MNELHKSKNFLDAEMTAFRKFSRKFYFPAVIVFMALAFAVVLWPKSDTPPSWHEEIIPSEALSYIRGTEPVALPDGDYPLAMPAGGTFVNSIAPMLMVEVDGTWYPLNIADDSIIPRQGKRLPLKILFGFTSPHAENTLHYKEKTGDNPVADYRKKAFYFLRVEHGFGRVQRGFTIKN